MTVNVQVSYHVARASCVIEAMRRPATPSTPPSGTASSSHLRPACGRPAPAASSQRLSGQNITHQKSHKITHQITLLSLDFWSRKGLGGSPRTPELRTIPGGCGGTRPRDPLGGAPPARATSVGGARGLRTRAARRVGERNVGESADRQAQAVCFSWRAKTVKVWTPLFTDPWANGLAAHCVSRTSSHNQSHKNHKHGIGTERTPRKANNNRRRVEDSFPLRVVYERVAALASRARHAGRRKPSPPHHALRSPLRFAGGAHGTG